MTLSAIKTTGHRPGAEKGFYRKVASIALPMALQYFMNSLVNASDALMLGFLNQSSLSAVSLAGQITFISNIFLFGLMSGENVLAAQYWGKGDKSTVEKVLSIVLRLTLIIESIIFLLAFFFPGFLMSLLTTDSELIELGVSYLRIVSWSYLFTAISQVYLCIMKNTGRALKSTIYGSCAVILNILINALLIFGMGPFPKLGIIGAAIATSIAKGTELALVIWENYKGCSQKTAVIRPKYLKEIDWDLLKDYIHFTWPPLTNQVIWGFAYSMNSVIMGHLGSDATAANAIAQIARQLSTCLCMGLGSGSGIIIGNELGSGKLESAKKHGDRLLRLTMIVGTCSGLILFIISPWIVSLASTLSAQSAHYLRIMLCICSYYILGKAFSCMLIGGIFSAGGDTRFGLICDTINMWLIIIPLGFLSAFVFKCPVPLVYFFLNLDEFTKMPAEFLYYKKYKWVKNITK